MMIELVYASASVIYSLNCSQPKQLKICPSSAFDDNDVSDNVISKRYIHNLFSPNIPGDDAAAFDNSFPEIVCIVNTRLRLGPVQFDKLFAFHAE